MESSVATISRSSQFDRDIVAVWNYVCDQDSAAADRQFMKIESKIEQLASHPLLGESVPQHGQRARRLVIGKYVVIYDVYPDRVHILRLYHSAQNV